MAEEVGSAYVRLMPSLRGFAAEAQRMLSSEMDGVAVTVGREIGEDLADGIGDGAEEARGSLRGLTTALAGLAAGAPAVAAVGAGFMAVVAGAAAAGIAVKAFSAAVGPQMDAVTEATEAAEAAEAAHEKAALKAAQAQALKAKGGDAYKAAVKEAEAATKAATEADAAYERQLAALPAPTREMATALKGLKDDHSAWSDSLAGTTMPVFTKGIRILRDLLPTLTPFVKAAASAFSGFLDGVAKGVKSAGFKQWAADMAAAAGPALTRFLEVIKNLAIGFAGLLQAFLPTSAGVTGGLVGMTAAFADWATGLKDSAGFAQFLQMARDGGATIVNLVVALGQLLVAVAPLLGAFTILVSLFASVVSGVPTPVLTVLAAVLVGIKAGMMGYAAGAAIVTAANRVMASSTYMAIAGWARMMAVGIMAYLRTGAAAVLSAATTAAAWTGSALAAIGTWIAAVLRAAAMAVAQFALMAARAIVWAAIMAAQWLIAMGPIGWIIAAVIALAALIIANWDKIKEFTGRAWDWIWSKVSGLVQRLVAWIANLPIVRFFVQHWDRIKEGTSRKVGELVAFVRGLPGRLMSALGNLGGLLVDKGMDIVRGLWEGIQSMGAWLARTLTGWAKRLIPGPIAKALGISSPSKLMADEIGRWIPPGIYVGVEDNLGAVSAASQMAAAAALPNRPGTGTTAPAGTTVVIDGTGMSPALLEWLRNSVRVLGGGNVQLALGQN
ncbi:hypothetical protein [Streptomyces sp. NPDC095602]|uniref:phage tail protein n=1 Tax=Streptomyces sp. NPDC095602 TaxID=3155819 RepID=UPI003329C6BB